MRLAREVIDARVHERLPRLRNVIYLMSEERGDRAVAYVETAAELLALPLGAERAQAVASVMRRIASFAVHLTEFELGNDVEIAGVFRP